MEKWGTDPNFFTQNPRKIYSLIDHKALMKLIGAPDYVQLRSTLKQWIEEAVKSDIRARESVWSEVIAVGSEPFVKEITCPPKSLF